MMILKITLIILLLMSTAEILSAHTPSKSIIKRVNKFDRYVLPAARKWNIEPALMKSILAAESAGNHFNGKDIIRSKAGALGAFQLMPRTVRHWGNKIGIKFGSNVEPRLKYDFSANVEIAAAYISHLSQMAAKELPKATKWEKLKAVIASYNAGERVIIKSRKRGGKRTWIPAGETINYVTIVTSYYTKAFGGKLKPPKITSTVNKKPRYKKTVTTLKEKVKNRRVNGANALIGMNKSLANDSGSGVSEVFLKEIEVLKNGIISKMNRQSKKVISLSFFGYSYLFLMLIWFIAWISIYRLTKELRLSKVQL